MPPIIEASHLGKTYRSGKLEVPALRDVTFTVEPGEFVSIVGPSGSGKSTLFYVLGGLTSPTSGIADDSRPGLFAALGRGADEAAAGAHRVCVSAVQPAADDLGARTTSSWRMTSPTRASRWTRACWITWRSLLGIKGRLQHRPNELSGGEQQRVALARALITKPAIVLADEPTGNLDTQNSDAVLEMLRVSSRELGQTVLMITHNPEAATIADRILHMRDGQIVKTEAGRGVPVPV